MEELGYYSENEKKRCVCGAILLKEWNSCTECGRIVKLICPECRYEVKENYKVCPKCGDQLYILSKNDIKILIKTINYLRSYHTESKPCPLCFKNSEGVGCDPDEKTFDYSHLCGCDNEIGEIIDSNCIKKVWKNKYVPFLMSEKDKSNYTEPVFPKPDFYPSVSNSSK